MVAISCKSLWVSECGVFGMDTVSNRILGFAAAVSNKLATAYYTEVLGFGRDLIEAPGWSFLTRDGTQLMLGECRDEVDAAETGNHSWFLHVMVELNPTNESKRRRALVHSSWCY